MPRFAANLSLMFGEVDFPRRFRAAAQAGFDAVECQFPYAWPLDSLAQCLHAERQTLVLHNLPAGDWPAGERGIAVLPDRQDEFRRGVELAVNYAKVLGCTRLNCLAGVAPAALEPGVARRTLVGNLRYAARRLSRAGLLLLVEPINTIDVPGFYVCGTAQAVALMDEVGAANLALQYDVYHMRMMNEDPASMIAANLPRIGHIQIADCPGRHEPGTGRIDFAALLDGLDAIGYAGWVGCEYFPLGSTGESLGWVRGMLPRNRSLKATGQTDP